MTHGARAFISTSVFGKSYLAKAWSERHQLLDYERRGFAQFVYLTACAHLESTLSRAVVARLRCIRHFLGLDDMPPMVMQSGQGQQLHSRKPLADSVIGIVSAIENDVEGAPLSRLMELYSRVFAVPFKTVVGPDISADINALAALRNLFAHGRDLVMDLGNDVHQPTGTLDGNPVQPAARRLFRAGIINDFNINGQNYHDWLGVIFSDNAIRYFYDAVRTAESALHGANVFAPEETMRQEAPLPPLPSDV